MQLDDDHWHLGRIGGIPVSAHWTVLLSIVFLAFWMRALLPTLIGAPVLLGVFIAHEFGHVWMYRRRRVRVDEIMLHGWHGHTRAETSSHRDDVITAWGGVAAQALLLALGLVIEFVVLAQNPAPWVTMLMWPVARVLVDVNALLMVIALIPIGPFDGRLAWQAFKLRRKPRRAKAAAKRVRSEPRAAAPRRSSTPAPATTPPDAAHAPGETDTLHDPDDDVSTLPADEQIDLERRSRDEADALIARLKHTPSQRLPNGHDSG